MSYNPGSSVKLDSQYVFPLSPTYTFKIIFNNAALNRTRLESSSGSYLEITNSVLFLNGLRRHSTLYRVRLEMHNPGPVRKSHLTKDFRCGLISISSHGSPAKLHRGIDVVRDIRPAETRTQGCAYILLVCFPRFL